ncbi:MAG: hypothetical protein LKM41_05090 [Lachnospiraceae bacterium]|nr:hypothetical protein [Lachnospiraceae bacterium]
MTTQTAPTPFRHSRQYHRQQQRRLQRLFPQRQILPRSEQRQRQSVRWCSWRLPGAGIFGAKFYQPQVWDCQRSPAFPVAIRSFRLSGLKAPYDQNLKKVNFAAPASDYVTFEYVKAVSELDTATKTRIVSSLKRYTGATAEQIEAAAVVKETLHSAGGTTTLSSIGLVWALGSDGFLYTAMDGAFKYSGGVGTYVTFAAHKTGDSIIYTPDETEPYTKDEIIDNNKLAPEDGTPTAPAAVTYQELIKVVDGSGTAVSGAMVTITKDDNTYSGTTDTNGYVQFTGLPEKYVDKATVTKGSNTSELRLGGFTRSGFDLYRKQLRRTAGQGACRLRIRHRRQQLERRHRELPRRGCGFR